MGRWSLGLESSLGHGGPEILPFQASMEKTQARWDTTHWGDLKPMRVTRRNSRH